MRELLPTGVDALAWHRVINEIQMLCHGESFNLAREGRGEFMRSFMVQAHLHRHYPDDSFSPAIPTTAIFLFWANTASRYTMA